MRIVSKKDIVQWDIENWSNALNFWSTDIEKVASKDHPILTLGERHGGISLWLATNGYKNICSDYELPEQRARDLHKKYEVEDLITYTNINIFEIPYPDNTFDVVIVKSVVGGLKLVQKDKKTRTLDNQKKAVREIMRVLKPGGIYLGAENMKGGLLHTLLRKYSKKDQGWRYMTQEDLYYLLDEFSETKYKFHGYLGTLFKYPFINSITGFLDKIICKIIPTSSRYIGFFIAKKPN
ncbi:MAG: class I SAM-dependent methyltransferase [Bacteroidetes bacterium]|nr:class I SAM-dependent methyltransferase [Bacteroidota bacterium]